MFSSSPDPSARARRAPSVETAGWHQKLPPFSNIDSARKGQVPGFPVEKNWNYLISVSLGHLQGLANWMEMNNWVNRISRFCQWKKNTLIIEEGMMESWGITHGITHGMPLRNITNELLWFGIPYQLIQDFSTCRDCGIDYSKYVLTKNTHRHTFSFFS